MTDNLSFESKTGRQLEFSKTTDGFVAVDVLFKNQSLGYYYLNRDDARKVIELLYEYVQSGPSGNDNETQDLET